MRLKAPETRRLNDQDAEANRRAHYEAIRELQKLVASAETAITALTESVESGTGIGPHTHPQSDITGLVSDLAGKIDAVVAGTNLSGGGTSGSVTLNVIDSPSFAGNVTCGNSAAADVLTVNGKAELASTHDDSAIEVNLNGVAMTAINAACVRVSNASTVSTAAGNNNAAGIWSTVTATESGGGNTLTNIAGFFSASGGDANEAIRTEAGDNVLNRTGGNTGIGHSSSATITEKLHVTSGVSGTATGVLCRHTGSPSTAAFYEAQDSTGRRIRLQANGASGSGNTIVGNVTAHGLDIYTNNTARVVVASGGDVTVNTGTHRANGTLGINTAPSRPLHVVNASAAQEVVRIQSTSATGFSSIDAYNNGGTLSMSWGYDNANTRAYIDSRTADLVYFSGSPSGTEKMRFVNAGAFQIGNSAAAVSTANTGRIRYVSASQEFQTSLNGAAYATLPQGSGTSNAITKWTAAGVLGNSSVTDNGTTVAITGALTVSNGCTLGDGAGDSHTVNGTFTIVNEARLGSSSGPLIRSGSGTPEGAITAPVGSLFLRTDGGAATTLYVKESGAGNTGWVGK